MLVSLVIPAYNEAENIGKCLEKIFNQKVEHNLEVIVIDSGSTDQTIEIVKSFSNVTLMQIPSEEFGHGRARNLGALNTNGEIIVFINADAIPVDENWLQMLIDPLLENEKIVGSFSRHLPKHGCYFYMARDLLISMPPEKLKKNKLDSFDYLKFSTVSAAIKTRAFEKFPFQDDILIAEDQEWVRRVAKKGLSVAYASKSLVYHSHNYNYRDLFNVKYQLGKSIPFFPSKFITATWGLIVSIGGIGVKIAGDLFYILRQPAKCSLKMKEIAISIGARFVSFLGRYLGWLSR